MVRAGRDAVRHARDGVGVEGEYFLELQLEELPTRVSNAIIDSFPERAETGASRIGSWPGKRGLDPEPWRRTPVSRQNRAFDQVEMANS